MRNLLCITLLLLAGVHASAQKKPLTHAVYDGWQTINERYISHDGKWVVYTITPQEGDATLVIQATDNSYKKEIPRGYAAEITDDQRFVICKIKPLFAVTREGRIKKKKPDEMPKDSLAIVEVGKDSVLRIPRIKSFKTPDKGTGQWLAYLQEKALPVPPVVVQPDSTTQLNSLLHLADSLARVADSLRNKANEAKTNGLAALKATKKEAKPKPGDPVEEGTELVLRNLYTGEEKKFPLVSDYYFSKPGNSFIIETSRSNTDTLKKAVIIWYNTSSGKADTVFRGFNDAKSFVLDDAGAQLAFIAERDSSTKALQKFYKLYYYRTGMDSARMRVDRKSTWIRNGLTVSETSLPEFSKNGQKLFFGLMPVRKPKDTTLVDFETARLDIWHYNDDYLQPQQLVQLNNELQRSFKAVLNGNDDKVIQLGSEDAENITLPDDNNVDYVLATTTKGNRVESQWQGYAKTTAYLISTIDGSRTLVKEKQRGFFTISPGGKYVIWYDGAQKNYFTYAVNTGTITNITKSIKVPLFDEEDDHPDDPPPHGIMAWHQNDKYVYVYDMYDVWQCDPEGKKVINNLTNGQGRSHKIIYRYMATDKEEKFINDTQTVVFKTLDLVNKYGGLALYEMERGFHGDRSGKYQVGLQVIKAKNADEYLYTCESFKMPPVLVCAHETTYMFAKMTGGEIGHRKYKDSIVETPLYASNAQQKDYNWLTGELVKWKMFDGKQSEGLLFKPEDFDAKKKYPMILYFYEKNSDDLYLYRNPAPSASTINIPLFVSNGYLVFVPDIHYKKGEPGESAYNSVVSAAKYFTKMRWVDSTKMAIQGQSWGGYQVAYLVTRTNMFAAAEAGAPVSNMTSAYGGIRWGTGVNRQFQYERTQSRIGYTLWQRPDLYIKNSPLFRADKVKTPLLITHNDADGAVPWYQGIEYFTALRRLGKKVWMLQYNGEDHNLVERRNRKDLSIRLSQYFDHFLKGAPEPHWLAEGVPATSKGIDWGTELEEKKGF
jgi:dipeptidyl aminopeptidase/acylaminoacyl peptidase